MSIDSFGDIGDALIIAMERGSLSLTEAELGPGFFDLRTGVAGEPFQKFVNYRLPLTIVIADPAAYGERFVELSREHRHHPTVTFVTAEERAARIEP